MQSVRHSMYTSPRAKDIANVYGMGLPAVVSADLVSSIR